jgi:hypothetical protein
MEQLEKPPQIRYGEGCVVGAVRLGEAARFHGDGTPTTTMDTAASGLPNMPFSSGSRTEDF